MGFVRRFPLLAYFSLAYAMTWAAVLPLLLSRRGLIDIHISEHWEAVGAFGPFVAALIVLRLTTNGEGARALCASLTRWRVGSAWLMVAIVSPFALLLMAAVIVSITGGQVIDVERGRLGELATAAGLIDLIVFSGLIQGLGEEPGWRGFAIPRLRERFGPLPATLILFPVWLCWHLPSFLSRPEFGVAQWLGFSAGVLSATIWLTWIYDATRSVAIAVLWHSLINIARGLALAMSMAMFLAIGNAVFLSALLIVLYWLIKKPGKYGAEYPDKTPAESAGG